MDNMTVKERIVPCLPPEEEPLRIIIDTDFANEIDDLYAVALALSSPERFHIEGFIATHFNNSARRQRECSAGVVRYGDESALYHRL